MPAHPRILSLDVTSSLGSISLLEGPEILGERSWKTDHSHAETVLPELESALREASLAIRDLDLLVGVNGPGSFTGIRIGLGILLGLGEALAKPLRTVSALEAVAFHFCGLRNRIHVSLDARRNQVFFQSFDLTYGSVEPSDEPSCASADEWAASLPPPSVPVTGSGAWLHRALLERSCPGRDLLRPPEALSALAGRLAFYRWQHAPTKPQESPTALYIRPPDAIRKASAAMPQKQAFSG